VFEVGIVRNCMPDAGDGMRLVVLFSEHLAVHGVQKR
jgi:hypothetical protein